ncbi:hypothetical protein D3C80_19240 [compost metagenome]
MLAEMDSLGVVAIDEAHAVTDMLVTHVGREGLSMLANRIAHNGLFWKGRGIAGDLQIGLRKDGVIGHIVLSLVNPSRAGECGVSSRRAM